MIRPRARQEWKAVVLLKLCWRLKSQLPKAGKSIYHSDYYLASVTVRELGVEVRWHWETKRKLGASGVRHCAKMIWLDVDLMVNAKRHSSSAFLVARRDLRAACVLWVMRP